MKKYHKYHEPIVQCQHCRQWGATYTQCKHCGAPIMPDEYDEDNSPMILCEYCNQFGAEYTMCSHCGAPMPERLQHVWGPYFVDGGRSVENNFFTYWNL